MASVPWSGSGSAGAIAAKVDVRRGTVLAGSFAFKNNSAANAISLSWDGGVTYTTTVDVVSALSLQNIVLDSVWVKTAGGAAAYEWIATDKEED